MNEEKTVELKPVSTESSSAKQVEEVALPANLTEQDKHTLELCKIKRALGLAQAEREELAYTNFLLQLTLKYKLTSKDTITEEGQIVRGVK